MWPGASSQDSVAVRWRKAELCLTEHVLQLSEDAASSVEVIGRSGQ